MSMSPRRLLAALLVTVLAVALRPGAVASASDDEAGEVEVPEPVEVCLSCHTLHPEEPLLEGPTLWQVVGRPVASMPGFEYSTALRSRGGRWENLELAAVQLNICFVLKNKIQKGYFVHLAFPMSLLCPTLLDLCDKSVRPAR